MVAKRAKSSTSKTPGKKTRIFCYTRDLTEALGVTRRTLYTYVQESLLPAPILYSNGRSGVLCRWTQTAMEHVHFINEQKALGYNLAEIKAMVAARWGTDDKLPAKAARSPQAMAANGNSSGRKPSPTRS